MIQKLLSKAAMRLMVIKGNGSLRRLEKNAENPMDVNRALLMKILRDNQDTAYGKAHHFSEIRTIEDYRKMVPVSVYEDFAPMIERTKDGEENLLTSAKILGYSRTSGSSDRIRLIRTVTSLSARLPRISSRVSGTISMPERMIKTAITTPTHASSEIPVVRKMMAEARTEADRIASDSASELKKT